MKGRLTTSVRSLTVAGILLFGLTAASPALANQEKLECNGRQQFDHFEQKTCPATPHRPVTIVQRVCCKNPAGKVHCNGFQQCPNHSES